MSTVITTPEELRALLGAPSPHSLVKERPRLHEHDRAWIAHSPFVIIATCDAEGNCDASPKGDPPGFVTVVDDTTLAIPERPGNRRGDGYVNILANPHVGLLFLVPGRTDTLRVNGRARLVRDAPYFDTMVVQGHRPILAIEVAIDTIYLHCAKAFLRSRVWEPATWRPDELPSPACLMKETTSAFSETLAEMEAALAPAAYEKILYSTPRPAEG